MVHLDKPLSLNPFGTGKVFKRHNVRYATVVSLS